MGSLYTPGGFTVPVSKMLRDRLDEMVRFTKLLRSKGVIMCIVYKLFVSNKEII